jgi:septal ring factor EnvC (AmiA/AmiB activator)
MCSEQFKIDRLEVKMGEVETRIAVIETQLNTIEKTLEEMKHDRKKEMQDLINVLQEKEKIGSETKKNRLWQVLFWLMTFPLGTIIGLILAKVI